MMEYNDNISDAKELLAFLENNDRIVIRQRTKSWEACLQSFGVPAEVRNKYDLGPFPVGKLGKTNPFDKGGWTPTAYELKEVLSHPSIVVTEFSSDLMRCLCNFSGCGSVRPMKLKFRVVGEGTSYELSKRMRLGGCCKCPLQMHGALLQSADSHLPVADKVSFWPDEAEFVRSNPTGVSEAVTEAIRKEALSDTITDHAIRDTPPRHSSSVDQDSSKENGGELDTTTRANTVRVEIHNSSDHDYATKQDAKASPSAPPDLVTASPAEPEEMNRFSVYEEVEEHMEARYLGRVREDFDNYGRRLLDLVCCCKSYHVVEHANWQGEKVAFDQVYTVESTLCCSDHCNLFGGTCCQTSMVFDIKDPVGKVVGHIQKEFGGSGDCVGACCRMMFKYSNFTLEFPPESTPQERLLLVASVFQIDFQHFEVD